LLKSRFNRRFAVTLVLSLVAVAVLVPSSPATFLGQDGLISFSRFIPKTNSFEIFTARPDGSDVRQLTSNTRFSFLSDWSPDGETIAFDSARVDIDGQKRVFQIYLMNADGSGVTQLTRGPGFHGFPGWSPDGTRLAIAADWGNYRALRGIWIIPASDPDGVTQEEALRLTTSTGSEEDQEPQFSPDGSSIVFTRLNAKRPQMSAIHRVSVDGTGLQRLTPWKLNASDPDWSPDGQMITFDSGDVGFPPAKGDIYVMGADGSGRTRLTDSPRIREGKRFKFAQNPVWSPSGTKIMYTRFQGRRFLPESLPPPGGPLVAINPDGSGKQVVVDGKNIQNKVDWGTHP
jgi:Tol biopolymer transport system component